MSRTWFGVGFGPIQSALFLFEAYRSGNFTRFVTAEVDDAVIAAVRGAGGSYTVNIAHPTHVEQVTVEGVELYNPTHDGDREKLLEAIAGAEEGATALPAVRFFEMGGGKSVAALLAEGIARRTSGRGLVIYAAENHNHAAEILLEGVRKYAPGPEALAGFQVVNTVVGKMSGIITEEETITRMGLAPMVPGSGRAILVEEFNRILVSRIHLNGYTRGVEVFEEQDDLMPFEEAKLYGHNAIHGLMSYLAGLRGLRVMSEAGRDPLIMALCREAFLHECGETLMRRHADLGDPLFTREGWDEYASGLLLRMTNPFLNDLVERVGRDPIRKLGLDDRLFGTMNLALQYGVRPTRLALGAAAAIVRLVKDDRDDALERGHPVPPFEELSRDTVSTLLLDIWGGQAASCAHCGELIDLCWEGLVGLLGGIRR